MHTKEIGTIAQHESDGAKIGAVDPAAGDGSTLDPIALEAIELNLEASLRVYTDHHFFTWTQGLLQNLIRHELLICVLRNGDNKLSQVDSFSTAQADPKLFSRLYQEDASLAEKLVKEWEAHNFQPVVLDAEKNAIFADSALARAVNRLGASTIIVHGTHDSHARMVSLFLFACRGKDTDAGLLRRVEMLVPFLHAAWVRTKISLSAKAGESEAHPSERDLLTLRELEVLKWVCQGKSNIEIGIILGISPLTVKNHVQGILRRLNVQNRTQAVGKAINLNILKC